MKAIVIGIGDELTSGQTVDTNSAHLARRLGELGIETIAHWTIADNRSAIAAAITRAAQTGDVVLISGGLGPTPDDVTRHGLADAMGTELRLDGPCLERLKAFFQRRGREMVEANQIQASIPVDAETLGNPAGTACGLAATLGDTAVYVMPGVPHEMRLMFDTMVAPRLGQAGTVIRHHVVHTYGTGESDVGAQIRDLMKRSGAVTIGTTVAAGLVSIRITSRAATSASAEEQIRKAVAEIRQRLGTLVFGEEDETMASVVGNVLGRRGQTLATAESCTGGLLGEMITDTAGASDYYLGGMIAYANRVKQDMLDVPAAMLAECGAVGEPVARAMAEGCRSRLAADWALSLTGIAGPGGGTEDKPVGLVYIGLAGADQTQVHRHVLTGDRRIVRLRSALAALNYLRLELLG